MSLATSSIFAQTADLTHLSGISVSNTSWREKDGQILVTGSVNNSSEVNWRDVVLEFRGFDPRGRTVLRGRHSVALLGERSRQDFSFYVGGMTLPSRYELIPLGGTNARSLDASAVARGDYRSLPDLRVEIKGWEKLDNRIVVRGHVTNASTAQWSDVTVSFRGFDKRGFPVVTGDYKLYRLQGRERREILFAVPSTVVPDAGEIALIDGTSTRPVSLTTPGIAASLVKPLVAQPSDSPVRPSETSLQPMASPPYVDVAPPTAVSTEFQPRPSRADKPPQQPSSSTDAVRDHAIIGPPATQVVITTQYPAPLVPPAATAGGSPAVMVPAKGSVEPARPVGRNEVAAAASVVSDPLNLPAGGLPGLSLLDATWREQKGRVLARGTIINVSEYGWVDVTVAIRGVDQHGRMVVDGQYKISVVSGRSAHDFSFVTGSTAVPVRCEIKLLGGKR